ncbi:AcrR family transcriptional regulator [Nocardioides zeae]|uniref:AcrR family transcriptional regulator n=2 Tax=Nocardioides zeae TaxID=1457234 RepID=A0ACC6IMD3_9ACTN|nr:TetR family transcriptional regulator [Nocardioides zeae]MDQ1106486.1 AcrR family transcriptional regulator [Nocardioides zeae]MDR6173833.1 AcrR family transcriptional regulator [Nocardioides zeae]MDR6211879.1 AcrR family transcriptional regulator [Nocardioides zeae]
MATSGRRGGRAVIIEGAVELFGKVGYHGASTRDIAAAADVTVASIYYHFKSKQQILQAIMVDILSEVIEETRSAVLAAGGDADRQLSALVRTWVLFHIRRQREALIGASEIRSLDEEGLATIVGLRDQQETLFRAVIDRGVADGTFGTAHPREAARAIINMSRSIVTWYHADGPVSPEEMAATYADLALAMAR